VKVEDIAGLSRLRHIVGRLDHDDELLRGVVVTLLRSGPTVIRIACATSTLAWDCYRICAGIRFRRENEAAYLASELASLDTMALAA
jgi:hypothetical protein